ncbi:hypothetical protein ACHAPJ_013017 [Fusarium lateritium]
MANFDIEEALSQLSLDEKIQLLSGKDFWHTHEIRRLGIPSVRMSDGPNGVRGIRWFNPVPTSCFPCGTAMGATWDADLIYEAGRLMSDEARQRGVHCILGPTVNIQRGPLGGRGFESFSEDPHLSGTLAAAIIRGIQSDGVTACLKHYVCNDMEHERKSVSVVVSRRALREIYLMPFQIAIRDGQPRALMTAYNRVNGIHVAEDPYLLQNVLLEEWKYRGLTMSDWFGTYSTSAAVKTGLDLEMPGPSTWRGFSLKQAHRASKVTTKDIDARVRNVLKFAQQAIQSGIPENAEEGSVDITKSAPILRRLASSSIVLLKNADNVLPLNPKLKTALIGPNARVAVYSGGGSAEVQPSYTTTVYDAAKGICENLSYAQGAMTCKALPLLKGSLRTADGTPGFLLKFYKDPPSVTTRLPVDELRLQDSLISLMDYAHPAIEGPVYYAQLEGVFDVEEDGEYMFGLSVYGTAKLFADGDLLIDNATRQTRGQSFFGAGTREEIGLLTLKADQKVHLRVDFGTAPTQSTTSVGTTNMGSGGFRLGCKKITDTEQDIQSAVEIAKDADQVIICAGLSPEWEAEGYDRDTMSLPPGTDELIKRVSAVNSKTVVSIQSGNPVTMPWLDTVSGVLQAWYGGNEAGRAITDVIFGHTNPSGKLPVTFPVHNEDNPAFLNFRSEMGRCLYGEDVYVGYRFYEKTNKRPLFSFGYGLSYSTFRLGTVKVREEVHENDIDLIVEAEVSNTSGRDGAEVVQLYVRQQNPSINRPPKELKGFVKVVVPSHGKTKCTTTIKRAMAASLWDEVTDKWIMEKGKYDLLTGFSSCSTTIVYTFDVEETVWWSGLQP